MSGQSRELTRSPVATVAYAATTRAAIQRACRAAEVGHAAALTPGNAGHRAEKARRTALPPELLIQDLPNEPVDGDGVETNIRGRDHAGVHDLLASQFVQNPLQVLRSLAILAGDPEVLVLETHPGGVAKAEDASDDSLIHQLA